MIVKSSWTFVWSCRGTREIHPKVDSKTQNMSPVWAMTPISRQHWLHSNMTGCLKSNERVYWFFWHVLFLTLRSGSFNFLVTKWQKMTAYNYGAIHDPLKNYIQQMTNEAVVGELWTLVDMRVSSQIRAPMLHDGERTSPVLSCWAQARLGSNVSSHFRAPGGHVARHVPRAREIKTSVHNVMS